MPTESGLSLESEAHVLAAEWRSLFAVEARRPVAGLSALECELFAAEMVSVEAVSEVQSTLTGDEFAWLCHRVAALLLDA